MFKNYTLLVYLSIPWYIKLYYKISRNNIRDTVKEIYIMIQLKAKFKIKLSLNFLNYLRVF